MSRTQKHPFANLEDGKVGLWSYVAGKLAIGAGVGAIVVFGPVLFIYLIYLVGTFLPPESKEADDPSQGEFSFIQAPTTNVDLAMGPVPWTSERLG